MPLMKYFSYKSWLANISTLLSKQTSTLYDVLHVQVKQSPKCTLAGAEDLIEGCTAELQILSETAASKVDLPKSLLLSGWLQRYCFTYASPASSTLEVMQNAFMVYTFAQSPLLSSETHSASHCCSKPLACHWTHQ